MSNRLSSAAMLLAGIEQMESIDRDIDAINQEIKALKEDIKDKKAIRKDRMQELRGAGFDAAPVEQMIRERRMSPEERRAFQAKLQVYRAMLDMLDGTPLGEAARRAFEESRKKREQSEDAELPLSEEQASTEEPPPKPTPQIEISPEGISAAREAGKVAARAGQSVTDNPYPSAQEELRAAFDEGWCSELGSDGMEIPAEFRRPETNDDDENKKEGE